MAFPAHKWSEQNYPKRALYYESAFLRFICSSLPTRRPDFPVWQYARELLKLHLPASDWALLARSVCCAPLELNSSAPSFKLSKKLPTGTSFIRNPEILWAFLLLRIKCVLTFMRFSNVRLAIRSCQCSINAMDDILSLWSKTGFRFQANKWLSSFPSLKWCQ